MIVPEFICYDLDVFVEAVELADATQLDKLFPLLTTILQKKSVCRILYEISELSLSFLQVTYIQGGPKKWYLSYIYYTVREVSLFGPPGTSFIQGRCNTWMVFPSNCRKQLLPTFASISDFTVHALGWPGSGCVAGTLCDAVLARNMLRPSLTGKQRRG